MGKVRQWIAWAERSLAALCVSEGLDIAMLEAIQGPLTITYRLRLFQPTRTSLARLLALGPAMAQALHTSGVRVSDTAQGILVEVPSPTARTPGAEMLARASKRLRPAVGLDSLREPVLLDLERWPHLLAVGPTRRGKTQALRSLLYSLARTHSPRRLQYLVMAKKAEDWRAFQGAAGCLGLLIQPEEQEQALSWLAGELLQQRAEKGQRWPRLLLIVDDLSNVAARASLEGHLGEIASMGGAAGLHLILSTQTTGKAGGLSQDIEQNLTARLIFGAGDAAAAARYTGSGGHQAEKIGIHPGDALLILDGQPQRVATGLCSDESIASLPPGQLPTPWTEPENQRQPTHPSGGRESHQEGREGSSPVQEPGQEQPLLDASRPPTEEEQAYLRELFQGLGSRNKTTVAAYGYKNGKVYRWVKEALEIEPT